MLALLLSLAAQTTITPYTELFSDSPVDESAGVTRSAWNPAHTAKITWCPKDAVTTTSCRVSTGNGLQACGKAFEKSSPFFGLSFCALQTNAVYGGYDTIYLTTEAQDSTIPDWYAAKPSVGILISSGLSPAANSPLEVTHPAGYTTTRLLLGPFTLDDGANAVIAVIRGATTEAVSIIDTNKVNSFLSSYFSTSTIIGILQKPSKLEFVVLSFLAPGTQVTAYSQREDKYSLVFENELTDGRRLLADVEIPNYDPDVPVGTLVFNNNEKYILVSYATTWAVFEADPILTTIENGFVTALKKGTTTTPVHIVSAPSTSSFAVVTDTTITIYTIETNNNVVQKSTHSVPFNDPDDTIVDVYWLKDEQIELFRKKNLQSIQIINPPPLKAPPPPKTDKITTEEIVAILAVAGITVIIALVAIIKYKNPNSNYALIKSADKF